MIMCLAFIKRICQRLSACMEICKSLVNSYQTKILQMALLRANTFINRMQNDVQYCFEVTCMLRVFTLISFGFAAFPIAIVYLTKSRTVCSSSCWWLSLTNQQYSLLILRPVWLGSTLLRDVLSISMIAYSLGMPQTISTLLVQFTQSGGQLYMTG